MDNNKKNIFREKVVNNLSKPDDLNDYLKVLSPKTWVLLLAIIVLMIGALIWGYFVYYA